MVCWVGLAGPSSLGSDTGKSLVGSGQQFQPFLASANSLLRLTLYRPAAIISSYFGDIARQDFLGKLRIASCGIIGSYWVVQARQHWSWAQSAATAA